MSDKERYDEILLQTIQEGWNSGGIYHLRFILAAKLRETQVKLETIPTYTEEGRHLMVAMQARIKTLREILSLSPTDVAEAFLEEQRR